MLKIRLKRIGKKHQPHYRIVVTEAKSRRNGRSVAEIGSWNPALPAGRPKEEKPTLKKEEYKGWLQKGAQPTKAVRNLMK